MSAPRRRRRWWRPALVGVAVVAVAVAAAFANVALLGAVGEDRIGRLRPVDPALSSAPAPSTPIAGGLGLTTAAAAATDDDDRPSGRGRDGRPGGAHDDD